MIKLAVFTELASASTLVEVALVASSTLALRATIVAAATATDFWSHILTGSFYGWTGHKSSSGFSDLRPHFLVHFV
jgi:hypothetical protein